MNNQLLVFLRRPELGKVKTRLAKSIGDAQALEVYNWLVEVTRNEFEKIDAKVHLYFDSANGTLPEWVNSYITFFQKGNDIGERMAIAFKDRFNIEPNSKLVLIGSDCPEISANIITEAFDALEENNVVLGPATDGGVYLIGLNLWNEALFNSVEWSTDSVITSLVGNCNDLNLRCKQLERLVDIDVIEDFLPYNQAFSEYKNSMHVTG